MGPLVQDLRYAVRLLLQRPGFTVLAALTLALGIGANTAIFSVVNAVMLRPLPYKNPDELVMVWATSQGRERDTATPANFLDWREQNQVFEEMAAMSNVAFNLIGDGEPERLRGVSVSTNFFRMLGVNAALGRTFNADNGDWQVVALSHGLWQRRFGADPGIIGKTLALNDNRYEVIGVMPASFKWPRLSPTLAPAAEEAEFFVPAIRKDIPQLGNSVTRDMSASRSTSYMRVVGRLKPGVSITQAQAEMNTIAARLAEQYPDANTGRGINLVPLHRQIVGNIRSALFVLLAAVGLVLAIACANIANLLLARAATRRKEIAIRAALGAGRARIVRQLLTESLLLALVGGGLGLLLAHWGVRALVGLSPGNILRLSEVALDGQVLGFTLMLSLCTGLLFGLLPALQASLLDLHEALKESGTRAVAGRHHSRRALVVAEVALSVILLIGAGLLLKSFFLLQQVEPGFDSSNLLTFKLALPEAKYPTPQQRAAVFQRTLERIKTLPGVQGAGATLNLPMAGDDINFSLTIEGRPEPAPGAEYRVGYQAASPGYFETMRIPLVRGRDFSPDDTENAPRVAIINETTARRYWADEDSVGKRIRLGGADNPWLTVIGVVKDVKHYALNRDSRPEAYVSYLQSPFSFMDIVVRVDKDPSGLVPAVRGAMANVDPYQPIDSIHTMDEWLAESVAQARFTSVLVGLFGVVALLLAGVGIYGVIAYSVTERTREVGIRMALGAQRRDVFGLIVGQGLRLVVVGVAVGLAAALALTRVMASLLYAVSATDPLIFGSVSVILACVALLACYLPARRAMKVDPMTALRYE